MNYLEHGRFEPDSVKNIKLGDLKLLYSNFLFMSGMKNEFYILIWKIVKQKLNIPQSILNDQAIIIPILFNSINFIFKDYYILLSSPPYPHLPQKK